MSIDRISLSSSQISSASYDNDTNEMVIVFKSGGTYSYSGVPRSDFDGLKAAISPGNFWNSRKNNYAYTKL